MMLIATIKDYVTGEPLAVKIIQITQFTAEAWAVVLTEVGELREVKLSEIYAVAQVD